MPSACLCRRCVFRSLQRTPLGAGAAPGAGASTTLANQQRRVLREEVCHTNGPENSEEHVLALLEVVEHRKDEKDIIMIETFLGGAISYIYIYIQLYTYIL